MSTTIPRSKINKEDAWCLEDIFATDELFLQKYQEAENSLPNFSKFIGHLTLDSTLLLDYLEAQDTLWELVNKLYVYAHMRLHQDGGNSFYQDLAQRSEKLAIKVSSTLAFADSELSGLTPEILTDFYKQHPKLTHYQRYLSEILRQKAHILDADTEALLAKVSEIAGVPQDAFSMLNNVDLSFKEVITPEGESLPLTHASYIPLMERQERSIREAAFKNLYASYGHYKNTFAALFSGNIKQYGLFSKTRHFNSPLEMALSANNIPSRVYLNLIQTVNQHLEPLHHYMALRKEVLNLDTLHMYDLFVPMVKADTKKYTFEDAKSIILKALEPMGDEYLAIVSSAFKDGWIDKYENEGKRSGAYSWGAYGAPHPYILLNHTDNLNSIFTLIHELGHAMHTYFSYKNQPHIYGDYCIFVAEVASTVNEALLMQYLLKQSQTKEEKLYLLNYFMDQFKSTLYRQTMFAEFEYHMHEAYQNGTTLTYDYISAYYETLVKKYHGPAVTVDHEIALEWTRIPHFYTPFYVYQYATGYSAAIALSNKLLTGGKEALTQYKAFLSGGSSKDPIDLLKIAGVDMSSPEPIEAALKLFDTLISDFKKAQ